MPSTRPHTPYAEHSSSNADDDDDDDQADDRATQPQAPDESLVLEFSQTSPDNEEGSDRMHAQMHESNDSSVVPPITMKKPSTVVNVGASTLPPPPINAATTKGVIIASATTHTSTSFTTASTSALAVSNQNAAASTVTATGKTAPTGSLPASLATLKTITSTTAPKFVTVAPKLTSKVASKTAVQSATAKSPAKANTTTTVKSTTLTTAKSAAKTAPKATAKATPKPAANKNAPKTLEAMPKTTAKLVTTKSAGKGAAKNMEKIAAKGIDMKKIPAAVVKRGNPVLPKKSTAAAVATNNVVAARTTIDVESEPFDGTETALRDDDDDVEYEPVDDEPVDEELSPRQFVPPPPPPPPRAPPPTQTPAAPTRPPAPTKPPAPTNPPATSVRPSLTLAAETETETDTGARRKRKQRSVEDTERFLRSLGNGNDDKSAKGESDAEEIKDEETDGSNKRLRTVLPTDPQKASASTLEATMLDTSGAATNAASATVASSATAAQTTKTTSIPAATSEISPAIVTRVSGTATVRAEDTPSVVTGVGVQSGSSTEEQLSARFDAVIEQLAKEFQMGTLTMVRHLIHLGFIPAIFSNSIIPPASSLFSNSTLAADVRLLPLDIPAHTSPPPPFEQHVCTRFDVAIDQLAREFKSGTLSMVRHLVRLGLITVPSVYAADSSHSPASSATAPHAATVSHTISTHSNAVAAIDALAERAVQSNVQGVQVQSAGSAAGAMIRKNNAGQKWTDEVNNELVRAYTEEKLSLLQLQERFGRSDAGIAYQLKNLGHPELFAQLPAERIEQIQQRRKNARAPPWVKR